METPERGRRDMKPDSDEELDALKRLEEAADAARIAGVYDPSEPEVEK